MTSLHSLWYYPSLKRQLFRKRREKIADTNYRANTRIRAKEVRVIDPEGNNRGVHPLSKALATARANDLDLVEIAPNANPPVCKVMDLGKFLYEQEKKRQKAKKSQKTIEVKEIRLRPKTTEHHRNFKVRDARRWLKENKKVNVRIQFRGREIHYPEIALDIMRDIAEELSDVGEVEQRPSREGHSMLMVLAPKKD